MPADTTLRFIVAQLGARMHYAVPRIFHEAGMLERLYTDSYIGNKPWLERALEAVPARLRPRPFSRLLGRRDDRLPPEKVTSFDLLGLRYVRARTHATNVAALIQVHADWSRRFCEAIVASSPPTAGAVWGFDSAALELFRWAKSQGARCILEQTIPPRRILRRILVEELEHWPGWQPGLDVLNGPDPIEGREEEEWRLADRIIVASEFTKTGIAQCGGDVFKCEVLPYGVDLDRFHRRPRYSRQQQRRLRLLFAGEVGLRKGAPYLLEALRRIGPKFVEARFAGTISLEQRKLQSYTDLAAFLGPVPRREMPDLFHWADVLVLPTVCDGFGVVQIEALACGVPVITTQSGGEVVRDGMTGFLVPQRDVDALVNAITRYISNPDELDSHRAEVSREVSAYSMDAYATRLVKAMNDLT